MSTRKTFYPYEDDAERLQALSEALRLERLEDVGLSNGYVLHDSRWWRVVGSTSSGGVSLRSAGSSNRADSESAVLPGAPDDLIVYVDRESGLQFQDGTLLGVPWPNEDLIYVRDARCRDTWSDPEVRVYGIFIRRYAPEGDSFYVPADRSRQPGVASTWTLVPDCDLILDWEPVDVADLLERMQKEHG